MASMEPLHGASPDDVAECPRCGARVRVARVGRHERDHEWQDELERRVVALEAAGAGRVVEWPTEGEYGQDTIEPDPDRPPTFLDREVSPLSYPADEPADGSL